MLTFHRCRSTEKRTGKLICRGHQQSAEVFSRCRTLYRAQAIQAGCLYAAPDGRTQPAYLTSGNHRHAREHAQSGQAHSVCVYGVLQIATHLSPE